MCIQLFKINAQTNRLYDIAQIITPKGTILIWLYDDTPRHKASFLQLAKSHYRDSLTFNRVIPDFVIQGGCPDTEQGFKDPEYLLKPEIDTIKHKHKYGSFAAGRDNNPDKISARCQFYIVMNKNGIKRLDGNYTVYGEVIKGMEVAEAIAHTPRDQTDNPRTPVGLTISISKMNSKKLKESGVYIKN